MKQLKGLDRVSRARTQLVRDKKYRFFAVLSMDLKLTTAPDVDTAAVDGVNLFFNEEFADKLPDSEIRGVLLHEVLHVAYGHIFRRGSRDPKKWNIACDHVVNRDVLASGERLPEGAIQPDPKFAGLNAEAVYALLPDDGGEGGKGKGNDPSGTGEVRDFPSNQPGKSKELAAAEAEAKWKSKVMQAAAVAAKDAGTLPASIARLVQELREPPKQDWRAVLEQFVAQSITTEPTWNRPNRRYVANGLYLPGSKPDAMNKILIAIDTSGSIGQKTLNAFQQECQAVLDSGVVDGLKVAYCDTKLYEGEEFERGDTVKFQAKGGGGTSFAPVMEWAAGEDAQALIYFTDLYCDEFGNEPSMPVLWAVYGPNQKQPPFGERVFVDPHS